MSNLDMHRQVLAAAKERRAAARKRGRRERAAFWQGVANDCRAWIKAIEASGNDDWIPF